MRLGAFGEDAGAVRPGDTPLPAELANALEHRIRAFRDPRGRSTAVDDNRRLPGVEPADRHCAAKCKADVVATLAFSGRRGADGTRPGDKIGGDLVGADHTKTPLLEKLDGAAEDTVVAALGDAASVP